MVLGPKAGGALGVVVGVVALAYTYHTIREEGRYFVAVAMIGPAALVLGLAYLLLPIEKLLVPTEIDGRRVYDYQKPTYTPLGKLVMALAVLAAVGLYVFLKFYE